MVLRELECGLRVCKRRDEKAGGEGQGEREKKRGEIGVGGAVTLGLTRGDSAITELIWGGREPPLPVLPWASWLRGMGCAHEEELSPCGLRPLDRSAVGRGVEETRPGRASTYQNDPCSPGFCIGGDLFTPS